MNREVQNAATDLPDDAKPSEMSSEEREQRIATAMQWYMAECEQGRIPDRRLFLSEYADVKDELTTCLVSLDFIHQVAPEIQATATGDDQAPSTRCGDSG